jgi:hypothetical protein
LVVIVRIASEFSAIVISGVGFCTDCQQRSIVGCQPNNLSVFMAGMAAVVEMVVGIYQTKMKRHLRVLCLQQ